MRNLTHAVMAAVLAGVVAALAVACAVPPQETYREIIAQRQAPQIEGLAERASPEQKAETATEAYWDLLKLRDYPDAAAVPELIKILAAHENSTRIHRFAAAQALFTAHDDAAQRALEKHLLVPEFPAGMAIMYSSHWQMPEPQRSRFIETYLLKNLADDLAVSLDARWSNDGPEGRTRKPETARLVVTVTLTNQSERALAVSVPEVCKAMTLQFRAPSGRFAPQAQTVVYRLGPPHAKRLQPGGSTSYDAQFELHEGAEALAMTKRLSTEGIKAVLKTSDVEVALSEFCQYQVSAMFEQPPLDKELQKRLAERDAIEPGILWIGRAVSKPVEVELRGSNRAK
jgi:hypothetical protein